MVITKPMALIESMRTIINHNISKGSTGKDCSGPPTVAMSKEGLISYQDFQSLYQGQDESKVFSADQLLTFLRELGLAFPVKAHEQFKDDQGSKLFILVPSLITDDTEEAMKEKHQEMVTSAEAISVQYKVDPVSYTHLTLPTNREV